MKLVFAMVTPVLLMGLAAIEPAERPMPPSAPTAEVLRTIPELAWHANPRGPDCSVTCWDHTGTGVHIALDGGNANERGGGSHPSTPYPGSCDDKHPSCRLNFAFAEEFERAIDEGDVEGLKWVLEQAEGEIYVASERDAIQILGCTQEVMAHVGLPEAMLSALAQQ